MNRILIADCETTGTGDEDVCIEIACAIYSVKHASVIGSFASLLQHDSNAAESINRIPPSALAEAPPRERVWAHVVKMAQGCDAILAHNAEFDSRFVPELQRPWICSCRDLDWPRQEKPGEGLVKLALAHGLGVSHAHRAAVDVDLLARPMTRVAETGTDLDAFLARGMRPKGLYQAMVSFEQKDLAKAAGFSLDGQTRSWTRRMACDDVAALGFDVRRIDGSEHAAAE